LRPTGPPRSLSTVLLAILLVAACGGQPSPAPDPTAISIQAARAELGDLITDVTAADAYRYQLADDVGRGMDTAKVIRIPEASTFAAVYHTWSDVDESFHVQLATSDDLVHWTWRIELAALASQPTIERTPDGAYVVAWEQEPDPIHMVVESFATWDDLRAGSYAKRYDVAVTMPACGEGTPSIKSATADRVEFGFHYHGGCVADREAEGSLDWDTWEAKARPDIDDALKRAGVRGHIGDRDEITFRGHPMMLIEGQLRYEDFASWRTFLYDEETGRAEQLAFRTHDGSVAFGNPTIEAIEIDGKSALVVGLYLYGDGMHVAEDGELIFYRYID
jgi:hypothetical protein